MKKGYHVNIEMLTKENVDFRRVLYTGAYMQLVLMTLAPAEEIGQEVHEENDQFFRFESGLGTVIVGETEYNVGDGDTVIVPAGTPHNVMNTGTEPLKLYTIYAPAHHKDGIVRATKADAEANEAEFDGATTE
jgi:mannose-6-phosphate isomerase-like protein (cupin superfamily)